MLQNMHPVLKMAEEESDDEIELIEAHDKDGQKLELVNLRNSPGIGGASKPKIPTANGGTMGRGAPAKGGPKQKMVTCGGGRGSGKKVVSRGWLGGPTRNLKPAAPLKKLNTTTAVQKLGQGGLGGPPQEKKGPPKAVENDGEGSRGDPAGGPSALVPEAEAKAPERPAPAGGKKKVGRPKKKALVGSSLPMGGIGKEADPLDMVSGASPSVKATKKVEMPAKASGVGGAKREPSPKKKKRGRPSKSAAAKRNAVPLEAPPRWVMAGESEDGDTIWKLASPEKNEGASNQLENEGGGKGTGTAGHGRAAAAALGKSVGQDGPTAGRGAVTAGGVAITAGGGVVTAGAGIGIGGMRVEKGLEPEANGVGSIGKGQARQAGKRKLDRTTSGESIEDVPLAKIGKVGKHKAKAPLKALGGEEARVDNVMEKGGPSERSGKAGIDGKGVGEVHEKVAVGAVGEGGVSGSAQVPLGQFLAQLTKGQLENERGGGASVSWGEAVPAQQDPHQFKAPLGFMTLPAKRSFPGGVPSGPVDKKPKLAGGRRALVLRAKVEARSGAVGLGEPEKGPSSKGGLASEKAAQVGREAEVLGRKEGSPAGKKGSDGQGVNSEERAVKTGERNRGEMGSQRRR
ncbi:hypothetical protein KFL_004180120 [Klebsormidium nitens]|uniref:Uncharacterized protein n=1 Tax=Klebsormidium nitens TaxID=105231 RepID=A0A1Y1II50_KLENI|nr:hypothetical protein KFL_004180120 [Klebsormidium nitens]|eukprot:GAQ88327.1 hypothetical protein KFL_004180120 [Klebsormidium nitens]